MSADSQNRPEDFKLPNDVCPRYYALELEPDLDHACFKGRVWIKLEVTKAQSVDRFWLNKHAEVALAHVALLPLLADAKDEDLGKVAGDDDAGKKAENTEDGWVWHPELERLEVRHPEGMPAGSPWALRMDFAGVLNNDMAGFYLMKFRSAAGETRGAVTQFEALDARRCFPCWDEPGFKAEFRISVTAPKYSPGQKPGAADAENTMRCVSNMPVREQVDTPCGSKTVYHFDVTPKMSTYLVTVALGDYDVYEIDAKLPQDLEDPESPLERSVQVRVFTPVGKRHLGKYAAEVTAFSLQQFEGYFKQKYPLPKLDLLAIPDFASGAMEGWGCLTFREDRVLVDLENTAADVLQMACLTLVHEVSHQWFGNLTTMAWWNDLWLNESFANYLEYLVTNKKHPEWRVWDQFVGAEFAFTQRLDALISSNPVQRDNALDRQQIDDLFDAITYDKGASVLRMLISAVSEEVFVRAMAGYMAEHAYKNTIAADLWGALDKQLGPDEQLGHRMRPWTTQIGYPLVTVTGEPRLDVSGAGEAELVISVEQKRFLLDHDSKDPAEPKWDVPIHVELPASHRPAAAAESKADVESGAPLCWLNRSDDGKGELRVRMAKASMPAWFKLNAGQFGLFRVRYPEAQRKALVEALAAGEFSRPTDVMGLLSDALALGQAGHENTTKGLMPLLEVFTNRLPRRAEAGSDPQKEAANITVWSSVVTSIGQLGRVLAHAVPHPQAGDEAQTDRYEWFCRWAVNNFIWPAFQSIGGWESRAADPHPLRMLRQALLAALVRYGHKETLEEAAKRVAQEFADPAQSTLDGNLRGPALAAYVATGGKKEWDAVLTKIPGSKAKEDEEAKEDEAKQEDNLSAEQILQYLLALTAAPTADLRDEALKLAADERVRSQELPAYLGSFLGSRSAAAQAWKWVKENWTTVCLKRFASANGVQRLLRSLESQSSKVLLTEIHDTVSAEVGGNSLRQLDEHILANHTWMGREMEALLEYCQKYAQQVYA